MRRYVTWQRLGSPSEPCIVRRLELGPVEVTAEDIEVARSVGGQVKFPLDEKQPPKGGLPARLGRPAVPVR